MYFLKFTLYLFALKCASVVFSREVTLSCGPDDVPAREIFGQPGKRGPIGLSGSKGEKGSQGQKGDPGQTNAQDTLAVAASCFDLKERGETNSGIYTIRPDPNATSFQTFCDMTSGGGGWTLVASVHENNINGKCTVGDKWSSEQGIETTSLEGKGSWENFVTFGTIESITSEDYKNTAYFSLKATDIMLWHVSNNVNTRDIQGETFLKYFTTDGFLARYESNLRSLFSRNSPTPSISSFNGRFSLTDDSWIASLPQHVPGFYRYNYDGSSPQSSIGDGGFDMYDTGNKVSFKVNDNSYTAVTYDSTYGGSSSGYFATSARTHPFIFLTWISNNGMSSFRIRVESNPGSDGSGSTDTYSGKFRLGTAAVGYRVFQIYNAGDASICEVYFHISNTQRWTSRLPTVDYPEWSSGTTEILNEMKLQEPRNIFAGYTLLSRPRGDQNLIIESEVVAVLKGIAGGVKNIPLSNARLGISSPVTFAIGNDSDIRSRVPTSETGQISTGYLDYKVVDGLGYEYAMCPGIRMGGRGNPALHCIGRINSKWNKGDPECGDFAGWNGENTHPSNRPTATGRSLQDIQSTILIFTRNTQ